ncbi:MAG: hypothetical protein ACOY90_00645 [Candidatus Zhuqueibacterota bacterium]
MGGKASLILIFGFSFLFSMYQLNIRRATIESVENYINYYDNAIAHEIAISGMNLVAAKVYSDSSWREALNTPFQEGSLKINFGIGTSFLEVEAIGEYNGESDTVVAYFEYISSGENIFLKYTMYTANENGSNWAPNDTVWGDLHTNGIFNHQNKNTIVFYGKVSAGMGIHSNPNKAKTQFLGGYEVGVSLPEVENMNELIASSVSGGYQFSTPADTMKLYFKMDGNVVVYRNSVAIHPEPGIALSSLSPNGVIYSSGPVEILGGVVNTNSHGVTVGSGDNVILRDNVCYVDNPETNPDSDDILGIVSLNHIIFDNRVKSDWYMQCALMAIQGSLTALVMDKSGRLDYFGSMYQLNRGRALMFQSFQKKYKHDTRFNEKALPGYPTAGEGIPRLRLVNWWE